MKTNDRLSIGVYAGKQINAHIYMAAHERDGLTLGVLSFSALTFVLCVCLYKRPHLLLPGIGCLSSSLSTYTT